MTVAIHIVMTCGELQYLSLACVMYVAVAIDSQTTDLGTTLKAHLLAVCRGTIFQANYFSISGVVYQAN